MANLRPQFFGHPAALAREVWHDLGTIGHAAESGAESAGDHIVQAMGVAGRFTPGVNPGQVAAELSAPFRQAGQAASDALSAGYARAYDTQLAAGGRLPIIQQLGQAEGFFSLQSIPGVPQAAPGSLQSLGYLVGGAAVSVLPWGEPEKVAIPAGARYGPELAARGVSLGDYVAAGGRVLSPGLEDFGRLSADDVGAWAGRVRAGGGTPVESFVGGAQQVTDDTQGALVGARGALKVQGWSTLKTITKGVGIGAAVGVAGFGIGEGLYLAGSGIASGFSFIGGGQGYGAYGGGGVLPGGGSGGGSAGGSSGDTSSSGPLGGLLGSPIMIIALLGIGAFVLIHESRKK